MAKKLYVGNLSHDATEDDIRIAFEKFGDVKSVEVVRDHGFGFVEMSRDHDASIAIKGVVVCGIGGKKVVVNSSLVRRSNGSGYILTSGDDEVEMIIEPGKLLQYISGFGKPPSQLRYRSFVDKSQPIEIRVIYDRLEWDYDRLESDLDTTTVTTVELTVDVDFDSFTDVDETAILTAIQRRLRLKSQPTVVGKRPGSVKLTLSLEREIAEQLLLAVKRGDFASLKVTDAKVVESAIVNAIVDTKIASDTFDVFMCYNSKDKPEVKGIATLLKGQGLLPWLDEWELRPGIPWQRSLEGQIKIIGAAAVFVGDRGNGPWQGPWQDLEIAAFLRQFVDRGCPVIPVILRSCTSTPDLPTFLSGMTWVDFRRRKPNPIAQLVYGITGVRATVSVTY